MSVQAILSPVFVEVLLTLALLVMLGRARIAAIRSGAVKVRDVAVGERAWPPKLMQLANAYHNQFETPVLFYAAVAFALITRQADLVFVLLSWLYVVLRLAHATIHVTTNAVGRRFQVFTAGALVLTILWIYFAAKVLLAPIG